MPTAANGLPEARMDLIVRAPSIFGPIRIDLTVRPWNEVLPDREGTTGEFGAHRKRQKYANIAVLPLVLEDSGRVGNDALGLVRKIAPQDPRPRVGTTNDLYQSLSATLQRTAANAIIAAMGSSLEADSEIG